MRMSAACCVLYLLKHEGRLNAVQWHILRIDEAEELEEQPPFRWNAFTQILHSL